MKNETITLSFEKEYLVIHKDNDSIVINDLVTDTKHEFVYDEELVNENGELVNENGELLCYDFQTYNQIEEDVSDYEDDALSSAIDFCNEFFEKISGIKLSDSNVDIYVCDVDKTNIGNTQFLSIQVRYTLKLTKEQLENFKKNGFEEY